MKCIAAIATPTIAPPNSTRLRSNAMKRPKRQVADARIHRHDGPASQEDVLIRVHALACRGLQAAGILTGRRTLFRPQLQKPMKCGRQRRAHPEKSTPRD
jgi:hypothetical protein